MTIETSELVHILAQVTPPRPPLRLGVAALVIVVAAALVTIAVLGLRPGLNAGLAPASFWFKTFLLMTVMVISLRSLMTASAPMPVPSTKWPIVVFAGVVAGLVMTEWIIGDARTIMAPSLRTNFLACFACVTLYGAAGMAGLTGLMRYYAPANLKQAAGWIGVAAAAAGAVGYSLHCPVDSPSFILLAYGLPILLLGLVARRVLPHFIKW